MGIDRVDNINIVDEAVTAEKVGFPAGLGLIAGSALPPRIPLKASLVIVPSELADWAAGGSVDIATDTAFFKATGITNGSIRMTPDGSATENSITYTGISAGDLTDTNIAIWFYVHEGTPAAADDRENINRIRFQLGTPGLGGYVSKELWSSANPSTRPFGWFYYEFPASSLDANPSGSGFAWADVTTLRIIINTTATSETPSITLGTVMAFPQRSEAIFCFNFDDGRQLQLPYLAYLSGLGIRATTYVTPGKAGTGDYITATEMREIRDMGHLVANHSWLHEDWDTLSEAEQIESVVKTARWLCDEGMPEGARIFAMPNGTAKIARSTWGLLRPHLDQLRGTTSWADLAQSTPQPWGNFIGGDNMYRAFTSASDNAAGGGVSEADMFTMALDDGSICIPLRHAIWTDFKTNADTVAAAVKANTAETMTMDELLQKS